MITRGIRISIYLLIRTLWWKADVRHDSDDGEFVRQLFFEHVDLPVDHRMGHPCVDLGRRDILMSQHFREGFQRYAVRQADRRGVGMAGEVERELFVDAAFPGYVFEAVVDGIQRRQFEQVTVSGKAPVFIQQE